MVQFTYDTICFGPSVHKGLFQGISEKIPLDSRITVNVTHFFNKYVEENSMDSGQILMSPCVDITFVNVNCCSQTSSLDGNMKQ